jgi:hypothetical protein
VPTAPIKACPAVCAAFSCCCGAILDTLILGSSSFVVLPRLYSAAIALFSTILVGQPKRSVTLNLAAFLFARTDCQSSRMSQTPAQSHLFISCETNVTTGTSPFGCSATVRRSSEALRPWTISRRGCLLSDRVSSALALALAHWFVYGRLRHLHPYKNQDTVVNVNNNEDRLSIYVHLNTDTKNESSVQ